MDGKVALEEHFALQETVAASAQYAPPASWPELRTRLLDVQERRLAAMDRHGIATMILSLNSPSVQAVPDARRAAGLAERANDFLAEQVALSAGRFEAFAALPLQDPYLAAEELRRCVRVLGFRGALVNGFTQLGRTDSALYYDLPQYRPFWAAVEELDVPFYLHPRNPQPASIYEGHPWLLGPTWAFGQETAVHALRLMGSGLFDAYPRLTIVLGHLGEGLPYSLWRIDHRSGWMDDHPRYPARRSIAHYFQNNFYVTTSGNFRSQSLIDCMLEIGADRILFSVDWPFEEMGAAAQWLDGAPISDADRAKIGSLNARRLFKLDAPRGTGP